MKLYSYPIVSFKCHDKVGEKEKKYFKPVTSAFEKLSFFFSFRIQDTEYHLLEWIHRHKSL